MEAIKLKTFAKPKYGQQIVALDAGPGQLNFALFDAVDLFIEGSTWTDRLAAQDKAKSFAEQFVAQMNAAAIPPVT